MYNVFLAADCVCQFSVSCCQFTADGEDPLTVGCEAGTLLNDKEVSNGTCTSPSDGARHQ